jgi:hypothetical protein
VTKLNITEIVDIDSVYPKPKKKPEPSEGRGPPTFGDYVQHLILTGQGDVIGLPSVNQYRSPYRR